MLASRETILAAAAAIGISFAARAAAPIERSLPDPVDDLAFINALEDRDLTEWLSQYLADIPPDEAVGSALAKRARLLTKAAGVPATQAEPWVEQADRVLADLIQRFPDHPGRIGWQLELARSCLERQGPSAFENLMLYELPGRDATTVGRLADQAIVVLNQLRQRKTELWKAAETLDERRLAGLRDSGSLAMLERTDNQSAILSAWARLYAAWASEIQQQSGPVKFSELLADVNLSGWFDLPGGREAEKSGALLIAAVCQRHLGHYDEADARARQTVEVLGRVSDRAARQRLRQTALIAVLEQIRANRDAGRYEAALQAVEQARTWCVNSRPDEPSALLAVALLEASILQARGQAATEPAATQPARQPKPMDWLQSRECLAALHRVVEQSLAHRDLLYIVLAPSLVSLDPKSLTTSAEERPFALQILLGCAVSDSRPERVDGVIAAVRQSVSVNPKPDGRVSGELQFLLGKAAADRQLRAEAIQILTDFVEQSPTHDRADAAARMALSLAAEELRHAGPGGSPASRAAFVRVARLLRQRGVRNLDAADLSYSLAAVLENDSQFEQAADEYAGVPFGHARFEDAVLGCLRCWNRALDQAGTKAAGLASLSDKARKLAQAIPAQIASRPAGTDRRVEAALLLAAAELLNHPAVGGSAEAVRLLEDFENRFATLPDQLGPALRQRILALRQLNQLEQARSLVDRYLVADPDNAGSVMASLLQAMHDEMIAAMDRGDDAASMKVAKEAAQLGQALLDWSSARPGRLTPIHTIVVSLWCAEALIQTGQPKEALSPLERADSEARTTLPADSALGLELSLVRADALLGIGQPNDALPLYTAAWQRSAEQSEAWWHGLIGSLRCHARATADRGEILQSIRQQRFLSPDLGGGRWKRQFESLERELQAPATAPTR